MRNISRLEAWIQSSVERTIMNMLCWFVVNTRWVVHESLGVGIALGRNVLERKIDGH